MNQIYLVLVSTLLFLLLALQGTIGQQTAQYAASDEDFVNPDRGWTQLQYSKTSAWANPTVPAGMTVCWWSVVLEGADRTGSITSATLQNLQGAFDSLRNAGVKTMLRFTYDNTGLMLDPSIDQMVVHQNQLMPTLLKNSDVILAINAGFIGMWGEWHSSNNGDMFSSNDAALQWWRIVKNYLDQLPSHIPVQVRTPAHKIKLLQVQGIDPTPDPALSRNSYKKRIGFHTDCFMASSTDVGTFKDSNSQSVSYDGTTFILQGAKEREYLKKDTIFIPLMGETCPGDNVRYGCSAARAELKQYHISSLNTMWWSGTYNSWSSCKTEIDRSKGYRVQLNSATLPSQVSPGGKFLFSFNVINVGYSTFYAPKQINIVLVDATSTSSVHRMDITSLVGDTRDWFPESGAISFSGTVSVPSSIPLGNYKAYLEIRDIAPRLQSDLRFNVRLGNTGIWDSSLGMNSLNMVVKVGTSSPSFTLPPTLPPPTLPTLPPTPPPPVTSLPGVLVYKDIQYMTLDMVPSDAIFWTGDPGYVPCDAANFKKLPTGWKVAPRNDDSIFVAVSNQWGTWRVILADGSAWVAKSSVTSTPSDINQLVTDGNGGYRPLWCDQRVLIASPVGSPVTTRPPVTTPPTTRPPVTTAPTTRPPVTTAPTTRPPVTTAPTTRSPTSSPVTTKPMPTRPPTVDYDDDCIDYNIYENRWNKGLVIQFNLRSTKGDLTGVTLSLTTSARIKSFWGVTLLSDSGSVKVFSVKLNDESLTFFKSNDMFNIGFVLAEASPYSFNFKCIGIVGGVMLPGTFDDPSSSSSSSSTVEENENNNNNQSSGGLSTGGLVAIILCSIFVGVVVITLVTVFILKKRKNGKAVTPIMPYYDQKHLPSSGSGLAFTSPRASPPSPTVTRNRQKSIDEYHHVKFSDN